MAALAGGARRLVGFKLADVERAAIVETLRICGGNRAAAARLLDVAPRTLRFKLAAYRAAGHAVPEPPYAVRGLVG